MSLDGENSVEKQHALVAPLLEISMRWCGKFFGPQVACQLLVNIFQTRGHPDAFTNREAEAMGLAGAVVWVLTDNHDFHFGCIATPQCVVDLIHRGKHLFRFVFGLDKLQQFREVWLGEFTLQVQSPRAWECSKWTKFFDKSFGPVCRHSQSLLW